MTVGSPLDGLAPPPADPRTDLPPFGSLPVVADLDELVARVIAPNPSPLTLDGTNTYVVGAPGSGVAVLVDPGPADATHLERVEQAVAARDAQVAAVLVTHHHEDHSEAARAWGRHFGATVHAPTRDVAGPDGIVVVDGDVIGPADARVTAVATPGHCSDHTAFRAANGAILVGDHVLGRGTSVVAFPDGDLLSYLDSLATLQGLGPDVLYPGHGPELASGGAEVLAYYAAHRAHREAQVLAVLAAGPATPPAIVEVVYAEVNRLLWPAAEASTRACLAKLTAEGVVDWRADTARLVPDRAPDRPDRADR